MVGFHYCYDLTELVGIDLSWFRPPFEDMWRASISWSFLFIAGVMCSFSGSNARRGGKYSVVALAVWAITSLAGVDIPISFGIIYCMAASTLLYAALQKIKAQPRGIAAALILAAAFLLLLSVPNGYIGSGALAIALPREPYSTEWFSWLGFPGPDFSSGDYYPLLPYCLMYLAGASLGPRVSQTAKRSAFGIIRCPPLEFIGRHALAIYLVHQPILLVVSGVAFSS